MTEHLRSLALALAVGLLAAACGTDAESTQTAAVIEPTAEQATSTTSEATEQPAEEVVETSVPTDDTSAEEEALADDVLTSEVTGDMVFEWVPSCSMGPPLTTEPADCPTFAGYTILRAMLSGVRTGTFDGTETFHAVFAVDSDGHYVFAGTSSFVGTVDGCGDGPVVFNSGGSGRFDLEQQEDEPGAFTPVHTNAFSYTPIASKLGALDVAFETTMTAVDPTTLEVSGTVVCGDALDDSAFDAVRPKSGVVANDARAWTGPGSFAVGETCHPTSDENAPGACPIMDGFIVMPLNNTLIFDGEFDGDAVFAGTNLVSEVDYEHSGILIFEGNVDGCGEGSVLMVNEAIGSFLSPNFRHTRGFTLQSFDTGSLGVQVDAGVRVTGQVSGIMEGSYSC